MPMKRGSIELSWPRLIGVASGIFGAAVGLGTVAQLALANSFRVLDNPPQFITSLCGCVFLFLAFPLYTGREWARRALLLVTYCIVVALGIFLCFTLFQESRWPSAVHSSLRFVIGICALIDFLIPLGFLLAVLHHADVRHAFQTKSASNHALPPTADRPEERMKEEL
jgi:hypothetical protein